MMKSYDIKLYEMITRVEIVLKETDLIKSNLR